MRAVILGASALAAVSGGQPRRAPGRRPPGRHHRASCAATACSSPSSPAAGTKWAHTWPVPAKAADVPLGLDGIPKRWWGKPGATTTWHAWQIDGTTSDVDVERPTWYLAHCQQGVGLKTPLTARPPVPPPTTQPYPKLGLASTAPLTFRRIEPVDQGDPQVDGGRRQGRRGDEQGRGRDDAACRA